MSNLGYFVGGICMWLVFVLFIVWTGRDVGLSDAVHIGIFFSIGTLNAILAQWAVSRRWDARPPG